MCVCVCTCAHMHGVMFPLVCKKKFKKDKPEAVKNGIQKGKWGEGISLGIRGLRKHLSLICETCSVFAYFKN